MNPEVPDWIRMDRGRAGEIFRIFQSQVLFMLVQLPLRAFQSQVLFMLVQLRLCHQKQDECKLQCTLPVLLLHAFAINQSTEKRLVQGQEASRAGKDHYMLTLHTRCTWKARLNLRLGMNMYAWFWPISSSKQAPVTAVLGLPL